MMMILMMDMSTWHLLLMRLTLSRIRYSFLCEGIITYSSLTSRIVVLVYVLTTVW
jgi:hypothetical protein